MLIGKKYSVILVVYARTNNIIKVSIFISRVCYHIFIKIVRIKIICNEKKKNF